MTASRPERAQINLRLTADEIAEWRARADAESTDLTTVIRRAMARYLRTSADKADEEARFAAIGRKVVRIVESAE